MNNRIGFRLLLVVGLALFAMYFGAGNLIFPFMIGVESGTNLAPAITGFLLTGVVLPVLALVTVATSENGLMGVATRIGKKPGLALAITLFLSTGVAYAIPRVAAVSYEIAVQPALSEENPIVLLAFSLVFFGITLLFVCNPTKMVEKVGAWLTPALLVLLALLIGSAIFTLTSSAEAPTAKYAQGALPAGMFQGYFTMDALASLVFGAVIINAMKRKGIPKGKPLFWGTVYAGIVAAILLTLVYVGLAILGNRMPDYGITNGAQGLTIAADVLFGKLGQIIFGAIAVLACLTTAIGLMGASMQFFKKLLPQIPRKILLAIHVVISIALANIGLTAILHVVAPLNLFVYPITIMLVVISLSDIFVPGQLYWTYRIGVGIAAIIAFLQAIESVLKMESWASYSAGNILGPIEQILSFLPMSQIDLAWVVPAVIGALLGVLIDCLQGRVTSKDSEAVATATSSSDSE